MLRLFPRRAAVAGRLTARRFASRPIRGLIDGPMLTELVNSGQIETVVVGFPDM